MKRWFLTTTLLAAGLLAQTPSPANTGSVSGRVVDADTLLPVPGAKVGSTALGWTLTDANGRYAIRGLASGQVRIQMDYAGGANIDDEPVPPRQVNVAAGRETSGVDFQVWLDGSISGHVLDANNEPLPGIAVTIFYQYYRNDPGTRLFDNSDNLLNNSGFANQKLMTDDRGAYSLRSPSMRAGRVYWVFAERERTYSNAVSDAPSDPANRRRILAPAYFPNAALLLNAVPVVLHSLERRDNVDVHLSSVPSYCVDGMARAAGNPEILSLAVEEEAMSSMHSSSDIPRKGIALPADRKFRVCDLHTGRYQFTVFGKGLPYLVDFFGTVVVDVHDADVHDLQIPAAPPIRLTAQFVWDRAPREGMAQPNLRVSTLPSFRTPLTPDPAARINAIPGEVTLFTLPMLNQGLLLNGLTPPFYIKDIELDGRSILSKNFDAGTTDQRVRITIGHDSGRIVAQTDAGGTAIFIILATAANEAELASSLLSSWTDDNGRSTVERVPPGKYYVLATHHPPAFRYLRNSEFFIDRTPETLKLLLRVRSQGQLVEVLPSSTMQVTLTPKDIR